MKRLLIVMLFLGSGILCAQAQIQKGEKLDNAIMSCSYRFSQKASLGKEDVLVTDTMQLDIGPHYSQYWNWSYAQREKVSASIVASIFSGDRILTGMSGKDVSYDELVEATSGPDVLSLNYDMNPDPEYIYKDRQHHHMTFVLNDENNEVAYTTDLKDVIPTWELTKDTLTVLNYLCYKATTSFRGRDYVAWFTPDIPLNDGPWMLYGLPGLILKVDDSNGIFCFEAVGMEKVKEESPILIKKDNYYTTKYSKYLKIKASYTQKIGSIALQNQQISFLFASNPLKHNLLDLDN